PDLPPPAIYRLRRLGVAGAVQPGDLARQARPRRRTGSGGLDPSAGRREGVTPQGGEHGRPAFPGQGLGRAARMGRSSASRIPSTSIVIQAASPTTLPPLSIELFQLTPKSWRLTRVWPVKPTRVTRAVS